MADEIYALLIADVMASSARKNMRTQLGKNLAAASERHLKQKLIRFPYTVTAGDEFQTIAAQLSPVPALLLDLRASLWPLPLRIGVGIGKVADRLQPPVNRLTGPAFQFDAPARELKRWAGQPPHRPSVSVRALGHRQRQGQRPLQI